MEERRSYSTPIQAGLRGNHLPVDEPGGIPEIPGHQHPRVENLIQSAEDMQGFVPGLGIFSLETKEIDAKAGQNGERKID